MANIEQLGDALYQALVNRAPIAPITDLHPELPISDAYYIAQRVVARRQEAGETIIGKKIGVTSKPVQSMLGVHQPDFGWLTSDMLFQDGAEIPANTLIQPRAEGEIAFVLGHDLIGPGVTEADVIAATDVVIPCFEIVDSRVRDWAIRIQDTVADNASSGVFVLGQQRTPVRDVDLATARMMVHKNGELLSQGTGVEALTGEPKLGSPVNCVAWLANTLSDFGIGLRAGEIILSGSLVPLEPVSAGDRMTLSVAGLGSVSVAFV